MRRSLSSGVGAASAACPSARRSVSASRRDTARRTISAWRPPPGVCTRSSSTLNRRCSGPWVVSSEEIRSRGMTFSLRDSSPVLRWSALPSSDQEVVYHRTRPVTMTSTRPATP